MELLLGIICGIALSLFFSFGPAFFSLIHNSIQYGYKKAFPFVIGVSASDVIIVFLMLTVLRNVELYEILHNPYVAVIGGLVLTAMGIYYLRKKPIATEPSEKHTRFRAKLMEAAPKRYSVLLQGFCINLLNPLIWVYWVSVVALVTGEFNLSISERYLFFIGVLGTTLGLDLLKCKLASLLQRIITPKVLNITNKATAAIMFGFAAYMVVSMIVFQGDPASPDKQQSNPVEMMKKVHQIGDSSLHSRNTKTQHNDEPHN